jgi:hypothetical protein
MGLGGVVPVFAPSFGLSLFCSVLPGHILTFSFALVVCWLAVDVPQVLRAVGMVADSVQEEPCEHNVFALCCCCSAIALPLALLSLVTVRVVHFLVP